MASSWRFNEINRPTVAILPATGTCKDGMSPYIACFVPVSVGSTLIMSPNFTPSRLASASTKPTTSGSSNGADVIVRAASSPEILSNQETLRCSTSLRYVVRRDSHCHKHMLLASKTMHDDDPRTSDVLGIIAGSYNSRTLLKVRAQSWTKCVSMSTRPGWAVSKSHWRPSDSCSSMRLCSPGKHNKLVHHKIRSYQM